MLPKNLRLSRQEFLTVKMSGKNVKTTYFSAIAIINNKNFSRFAVVTSSKLDKRAVFRNRLRRRIYQIVSKFGINGFDVIIFPRPEGLKLKHEDYTAELYSLLSKISELS